MQTQKHQTQTLLQPSNHANTSSSIMQTSYQTQKKLKNLFYIKSKHTRKYFNNHPYFRVSTQTSNCDQSQQQLQTQQYKRSKQNQIMVQQRIKTQQFLTQPHKNLQSIQFVNLPTQYGLENTFNYLQDRSFIGKRNKVQMQNKLMRSRRQNNDSLERGRMSLKYSNVDDENGGIGGHNYMKATAAYESRFNQTIESRRVKTQSLSDAVERQQNSISQLQNGTGHHQLLKLKQRRVSLSIPKQPQLHQSKVIATLMNSNAIYNTRRRPSINLNNLPARQEVRFLYGKRLKSTQQIPHRYITFDLFPFIIATFLKCKIHYKDMSNAQYNFVLTSIKKVLQQNKKPQKYDIKDIINISTIKALMQFLKQYKQTDYEWTQTIRYFFILNEKNVLEYHLNIIKEAVANMIAIKFNVEFGQRELFMFDLETKGEISQFYDLLKTERFLIGDESKVMMDYLAIENQQTESKSMQAKIQKWKSLAECGNAQTIQNSRAHSTHQQSLTLKQSSQTKILPHTTTRKLSQEKFNLIFQQFKIRQQKRISKQYVMGDSKSTKHKSRDSFIERSRLKKEQDFFQ